MGEHEHSVFRANVQAHFNPKKSPHRDVQAFQLGDDKGEPIQLKKLSKAEQERVHLSEARLSILLLWNRARAHLHALTVMVQSKRKVGSDWTVAVHLPDDREGENPRMDRDGCGACSHAALHCHVGPTVGTHPKVRVPMPPLAPFEVVEWVMSQVVPSDAFEPAPWDRVMAALKQESVKPRANGREREM